MPAEARETVHAAIKLSKKTWVPGIAPLDRDHPSIRRVCGGNIAELVSFQNNRRVRICYEAGYDGFWVNRGAHCVKADRIDVLALLRALTATNGENATTASMTACWPKRA